MAIKTTDTTNSAGCSPCTPEASKGQIFNPRPDPEMLKITGENRRDEALLLHLALLEQVGLPGKRFCMMTQLERTCEGAQYFDEEA